MAISSPSFLDLRKDDVVRQQGRHTRPAERVLGVLEAWIDMRTRRERVRLDAVIAGPQDAAGPDMHARSVWWNSWRACKRRRV